jgi:acetyl-CoA synthetase
MAAMEVRNTFVPPTALRMLRTVANPRGRFDLKLRTIASGGEALGAETFAWGREALGLSINEFYGQTECNLVLSSCAAIGVASPAASASRCRAPCRRHPRRRLAGPARRAGPDCGAAPRPVMFLGYWNNPAATGPSSSATG